MNIRTICADCSYNVVLHFFFFFAFGLLYIDGNDLVPDGQAGAGIFNCPDDFIAINQVRLCGERFNDGIINDDYTENAPVKDIAAGPIILPFRSDAEFVGRGFRLVYKQEKCG